MNSVIVLNARKALIEVHIKHMAKTSTMQLSDLTSIARNKPRQLNTTNGITNAIIDFVTYSGGFANRISSAGRKIKTKNDKEIYISGTTKKGTPDIDIIFNGLPIKVEVKNIKTKDKISDKQSKVKAQLEAAGAIYFIAESFDSFYAWWIADIVKVSAPAI